MKEIKEILNKKSKIRRERKKGNNREKMEEREENLY